MKIKVICNYFGTPPKYFQLWLDSCGCNPALEFLLFTDLEMAGFNAPENVTLFRMKFEDMKRKIQNVFKYPIKYNKPWDFCAFRPCFGTIFQNEIGDANFWGWCDLDVIFGDLSPCIMKTSDYDKIMSKGHFSLVRNNPLLNDFIMSHPLTRIAIEKRESKGPIVHCYDELHFRFTVLREFGAKQLDEREIPFCNLNPRYGNFVFDCSHAVSKRLGLKENQGVPLLFTWRNGQLLGHFALENHNVVRIELAYAHFIKRDLVPHIDRLQNNGDNYMIEPNGVYLSNIATPSWEDIMRIDHYRIHWRYYCERIRYNVIREKFLRALHKNARIVPVVYHDDC